MPFCSVQRSFGGHELANDLLRFILIKIRELSIL